MLAVFLFKNGYDDLLVRPYCEVVPHRREVWLRYSRLCYGSQLSGWRVIEPSFYT